MVQNKIKRIPVFYASDENYAKPLTVSMYSVLANTTHHIDFYILENDIKSETKEIIQKSLACFDNFTITYLHLDKKDVLKSFPVMRHFTLCNYFRYFMPELCPNIKKCVYLDVDTIVRHDIYDLYSINLGKYLIGAVGEVAVNEMAYIQERIRNLELNPKHVYFCSGIMLMNLEKCHAQDVTNKLIKLTEENWYLIKYVDQDVLNILFDNNQYKSIDLDWGREIRKMSIDSKKKKSIVKKCKIIHYDGERKPWNQKCWFDGYFWLYAKKTLFYPKPSFFKIIGSFVRYVFCISKNRKKYKKEYQQNKTAFAAYNRKFDSGL